MPFGSHKHPPPPPRLFDQKRLERGRFGKQFLLTRGASSSLLFYYNLLKKGDNDLYKLIRGGTVNYYSLKFAITIFKAKNNNYGGGGGVAPLLEFVDQSMTWVTSGTICSDG